MQLFERFRKRLIASGVLSFLIAFCTVSGTMAFLQDSTDRVENVFTYGSVALSLTESVVSDHGVPVTPAARTSSGQTYKLVPGRSYVKDPIVTVDADSEPCYIYLLVDNPVTSLEDTTAGTIASQISTSGWSTLSPSSGSLYYDNHVLSSSQTLYYKTVSSSSSDQDLATFSNLNIDLWADVTVAAGLSLDVTAFAVQQDGFATALAAWEATFGEHYDPTEYFDFGTSLEVETYYTSGEIKATQALGGSSCRLELDIYKSLQGQGSRSPIFISNYICVTSNGNSDTRLWVRDSVNGNSYLADEYGVDGTWRLVGIGGWNTRYRIVAEGSNVWVNDTLVVTDAECYGWGDFEPQIFGHNPDNAAWTSGYFYSAKLYADDELVMDLAPARRKADSVVGLFDYVENLFFEVTGQILIHFPSS